MSASLACPRVADGGTVPSVTSAVPPAGTARRLQALAFNGWSINALASRLGVSGHVVRYLQHGRRGEVPQAFADSVCVLYDQLWDVHGPSARSAAAARARDWCPPLAWDDHAGDPHWIDDPAAEPADWKPRRLTAAERGEEIAALMSLGCTPLEAAVRLGITRDALQQRLSRAKQRN